MNRREAIAGLVGLPFVAAGVAAAAPVPMTGNLAAMGSLAPVCVRLVVSSDGTPVDTWRWLIKYQGKWHTWHFERDTGRREGTYQVLSDLKVIDPYGAIEDARLDL